MLSKISWKKSTLFLSKEDPNRNAFEIKVFPKLVLEIVLYGCLISSGKLQKNANEGTAVGNWVTYLIFTGFPLTTGGWYDSIAFKTTSFNCEVEIFVFLFSATSKAISMALKILVFSFAEINKIGTSVKGASFCFSIIS